VTTDTFWHRRGEAMLDAGTCLVCLHANGAHALGCRRTLEQAEQPRRPSTFDDIPSTTTLERPA
jgi:hypothetical protein